MKTYCPACGATVDSCALAGDDTLGPSVLAWVCPECETPSIVQDDMDDEEAFVKVWREIHGKGSWEQRTPTWRYEWEPMEGTK